MTFVNVIINACTKNYEGLKSLVKHLGHSSISLSQGNFGAKLIFFILKTFQSKLHADFKHWMGTEQQQIWISALNKLSAMWQCITESQLMLKQWMQLSYQWITRMTITQWFRDIVIHSPLKWDCTDTQTAAF